MKIVSLSYRDNVGTNKKWVLNKVLLSDANLVVGKNSTGKTRLVNVILGLSRLIDGPQKLSIDNSDYTVEFADGDDLYLYELIVEAYRVKYERLVRNGSEMFRRSGDGTGTIYYEELGRAHLFSVPEDVMILSSKRDRAQHPFIECFHDWASSLRYYPFGTSLGKEELTHYASVAALLDDAAHMDPSKANQVYAKGYHRWGAEFDAEILKDLARLSYPCGDVGIREIEVPQMKGFQIGALFIRESDLDFHTFQMDMSQGMYRALCMVVHLNYNYLDRKPRVLLIDDVGEGLDYERSSAFVRLLIEKCQRADIQLVMTTNDRFVMNAVSLAHWCILDRRGGIVSSVTQRSHPEIFKSFKFLGLNNFDLFANDMFRSLQGVVE